MTEALYDQSVDILTFEATVLSCRRTEGGWETELDRTAFFPEQGGQYADCGVLATEDGRRVAVTDAQIREGVIFHLTQAEIPAGSRVRGAVDGADRFDKMQQHTGEHIVSGLVYSTFGFHNVGFRLSKEHVTMDYDGVMSMEQLLELEEKANEAVWKNLPVEIAVYASEEEAAGLDYRSKIEIAGQVRIVTVPGYDTCACCAPHVKRTGEIGLIKIVSAEKYKGGTRVGMLCGRRALRRVNELAASATEAAVMLSVRPDDLTRAVAGKQQELLELTLSLSGLKRELLESRIAALPGDTKDPILVVSGVDDKLLQHTVDGMMDRFPGFSGILNETAPGSFHFVIGSRTEDCRVLAAVLRREQKARGGGQAVMIQGSIACGEAGIRDAIRLARGEG